MTTLAAQLTELESKLATAAGDREAAATTIETDRETLHQSEQKLQKLRAQAAALEDRVDATKRVASAGESAEQALSGARESSANEVAATKDEIKAWDKLVEDVIPKDTLKKLPKAIKKVDDAIADKLKKAGDADKDLADAEAKLTKAQEDAADAETAHANWQAELQVSQQSIEQCRASVAATKAEAKAALDTGDFETAFIKLRDLESAVKALEEATAANDHKALLDQLPNLWAAVVEAGQALGEATDEVAGARAAADAAHAAFDVALRDRKRSITTELEPGNPPPPASPPAPGAGGEPDL